jgi:hypothetical protein
MARSRNRGPEASGTRADRRMRFKSGAARGGLRHAADSLGGLELFGCRGIDNGSVRTIQQTKAAIQPCEREWKGNGLGLFALEVRSTGELPGYTGLTPQCPCWPNRRSAAATGGGPRRLYRQAGTLAALCRATARVTAARMRRSGS